ncbi:MAG TPA: hypothetical protein VMF66_15080 [Candidatus Acidoferrum sp.]|nr:hypothetical protein [Candidatus Acidoferrum sp.]
MFHLALTALSIAMTLAACAGSTGRSGGGTTSPPPPSITVTVQPASATLFLGQTQQFQATVTGTSNTSVNWTVNGVAGGNSTSGTISASGLYTAPAVLPTTTSITIAATSAADSSASGTATVSLHDDIAVSISPASATVLVGGTQVFTATVTGSGNPATGVTWAVNGVAGGNASNGTIVAGGNGSGTYTAPTILPATPTVTVTAMSVADSTASGSATVTLKDDVAVSVSPASATVPAAGIQVFTATVTGSANPATGVTWAVNGIGGGSPSVGTIVANGADSATYTAPVTPPSPPDVTITASSVADPSKTGAASVTITCANLISPASASLSLGQTQTLTASLCIASGTAIVWDVNGIAGGNSALGTIVGSSAPTNAALYTAPADLPSTNPVTIHATAGGQTASATITITSSVSVTVSPASATVNATQRATFTASVANSSDGAVAWSVNGLPNGSATVGEICVVASNPCVPPSGAVSGSVDYVAPAAAPGVNPVTLAATSEADPSKVGIASVFVAQQTGPLSISVSPLYAFVVPSGAQPSTMQFSATVSGANVTGVTWSVQSAVVGQGCTGAACGTIGANGVYTAPTAAPSPNAIAVVATSVFDSTKSGSATVAITSGPTIRVLLPSSVMAGAVESFPFEVQGVNFVVGSGGSASVILLNGQPRATTCATPGECVTVLNPADVQSAATITVQVQNPGPPGTLSNPVPFVVTPFDVSVGTISLGLAQPSATENVVVAEPTTAAASSPINVDFIGFLSGGTCGAQGSPLTVTRPTSGSEVVSLCVHGNGLDPTFAYAFTEPSAGADIGVVASSISGIFPNMIELDLTISSVTQPGVRSLFTTTLNNDRAVATGVLEVQ